MIDKVICAICNYSGKNITKHIMKKHNMNISEYKRIYQSEIECENSKKLRANNRRNTIRKKYGVDNVSQLESIKNKIQKSIQKYMREKYDVDNIFQVPEIKKKTRENREKTLLAKYGTTNIMQVSIIKEKMRQSIQNLWNNPNSIYHNDKYGQFSAIEPNKTEQKIIDLNIANVKYTGNFSFWVTFKNGRRKNPDFIITPFHKNYKVIELFGGKNFFHTSQEAEQIIQLYKDINIQCLVIWDYEIRTVHQLNYIKQIILDFIKL